VDQINGLDIQIKGSIMELDVVEYHDERVETLEKIKLPHP
jgi:hypothetical protein